MPMMFGLYKDVFKQKMAFSTTLTHKSKRMSDELITKTEARLNSHEQVCAERYASISKSLENGNTRMTKIEYLLYGVMLCVLLGPGTAAEFFKKFFGV